MKVVVDTNIVFSALLKTKSQFREHLMLATGIEFYTCRLLIVELFKHKEKLVKTSNLEEAIILSTLYDLLKTINLYNEDFISAPNWAQAYEFCHDIDLKDIPFIALSLELKGWLWTGDQTLISGLTAKGFERIYQFPLTI